MTFPPPPNSRFAPPPPRPGGTFVPGQNQQPQRPAGMAPPPPPGSFVPPPQPMQTLNAGMQNMGLHSPPGRAGPPPPGTFVPSHPPAAPQPPGGRMMPPTFVPAPPPAATPPGVQRSTFTPGPTAPPMAPPVMGGGAAAAAPAQPGFYPVSPSPSGPMATAAATPQPLSTNEHIDYSVQIPLRLFRWTSHFIPQTSNMASKIPFGAVLRPLAYDPQDDSIESVQPGSAGIVRCKRCRLYMNPFVSWTEHGRRWRCNICGQINDTPSAYFCHLDEHGLRRDRLERPELSQAVVEYLAPAEYMVRPPQEPTYFFVLDVSATSVRSGMLAVAARTIKQSLDDLPGHGRTKVGFITFDNGVHYYNLNPELSSPQMLVVADLNELFVPLPDHLLVNLQESRAVVEAFLDSLPEMFIKNPVVSQSCLGPALKAAFTVMKQIGGKMSVFQSILPTLGDGALKPREQPGIMGTPNEVQLLKPGVPWYKDTALEFSRQQISVDLYLFPYQYMDLASLGDLAKYSAGTMHSFVNFNEIRDGPRFEAQLNKNLTQTTAFEAVMRIRCTKGMRITNFYGNFFVRGSDLLALPNCSADSVFGFDLAHDEQSVNVSHVTVQAALLYTSANGERRIRVMTQALPVSSLTSEIVSGLDADACVALMSKQALDVAMKSSLDNARMRLQQVCVDVIRTSKEGDKRTVSGYSVPPPSAHVGGNEEQEKPIPENLASLPLYTLATMKNVAFRGGTDVHPDERVQSHYYLSSMWVDQVKRYVYPKLFAIHEMDAHVGLPAGNSGYPEERVAGRNGILLPENVSLTVDRLTSNGVFLLDNGVEMYLWVGRSADMNIVASLFGVHSLDEMDPHQIVVMTSGDPFANRFGAITHALRECEDNPFVVAPKINVVREGDPHLEGRFFWFLVEDRASFQGGTYSYREFLDFVRNPQASSGSAMPPGGGRAGPPGASMGMGALPPGAASTAMPPPHQGMPPPSGMGPPPVQNGMPPPGHAGMPPPQRGMPPPGQPGMPPPLRGMPPPGQPGMPPPQRGMPPPGQPGMPPQGGMPPPQRGMPPPPGQPIAPPGRAMPQPPPGAHAAPPGGPPTLGPPSVMGRGPQMPPPAGKFAAPPPQPRSLSGPPSASSFGSPPPRPGGAVPPGPPPPPGRSVPGAPPPQRTGMAAPPPRGNMPPPPPRR